MKRINTYASTCPWEVHGYFYFIRWEGKCVRGTEENLLWDE
jgi:hypothetical protein